MNRIMTTLLRIGISVGMLCLVPMGRPASAQEQKASFATVTGTVAYLQRSALPPNATLRVRLEDVSRQDVAAPLISEVVLPTGGKQVPLAFALPYRSADILAQHRYQVRATLLVKDKMLFTTTRAYPVITGDAPSDVTIVVQPVAPPPMRTPAGAPSRLSFVDTVWKVRASRQASTGQIYVFLSEGTLVMASRTGKPSLGSWTYKNGLFTMTEEGQRYKVDILKLTPGEFRIKSNNPGEPVMMTLVPARGD